MADDDTSSQTIHIQTATPSNSILSHPKFEAAIRSLTSILPHSDDISPPNFLSSSANPALSLLHHSQTSSHISALLRHPHSGSGDNTLCRWLYDTFQSGDPDLQLVVLSFLPVVAGVYLSRVTSRKSLAGFEAVLLALYAYETTSRGGESVTVNVPDLSHPSVYHESKAPIKNSATELHQAILSPTLVPHGTVRSTRRARIVGVALELYYSKIHQIPAQSKIDFCEFCALWSGQAGDMYTTECEPESFNNGRGGGEGEENESVVAGTEGRIPLPWELLQPVLRILGHCMLGPDKNRELVNAGWAACCSLYARSIHDVDPTAILATGSLLKIGKMGLKSNDACDPTEIQMTNVINL